MKYIELINKNKKSLKTFLRDKSFSKRAIDDLLNIGIIINDKTYFRNKQLKNNDIIKIPIIDEKLDYEPIKANLDIIYEDEHILIINKAYGITINSKNQISLANLIANYFLENEINSKIRFINRLDMNTSGLIMIAKNKFAQAYYQKEIENGKIIKKYLAIVAGKFEIDKLCKFRLKYNDISKRYEVTKDGKLAVTYFKSLGINKKYSIIECDIKTGKTHQIRSSLKYLNHPIIGDELYGSNYHLERFLLHSYYLKFTRFLDKESIVIKDFPNFKPFLNQI